MERQHERRNNTGERWMALGWATLGATTAIGAAALVATVRAQDQPPPPAPRPGFGGGGFGGGQGFPGGPGGLGGPRFGGAPVAVAVGEGAVFVVRGNTLYRMNPQSLRVEGQTALPEERQRTLRDGAAPRDGNDRALPPGRPGQEPEAPPEPNR